MEINPEAALFYGFIFLLVLVVATLIFLLIHSGFFSEINIQTCKPCIGEIKIAYKHARGPYKESGTLFTEVHTLLPQYRTIGVYYDDPRKKEPNNLRYLVGLILSENSKPVDEKDVKILEEWNYKFATFPSINHAVQTSFPFSSTLSIIFAVFRVYPVLNEYIETRSLCAHPFIEIYDCKKAKIFFVGPLESQNNFYVPEVLEDDEKTRGDDDEGSTVSCDDSASYIKYDGFDSDSLADQPSLTEMDGSGLSEIHKQDAPVAFSDPAAQENVEGGIRSPADDDSDNNTASSFEEIDESMAEKEKEEEGETSSPDPTKKVVET